MSPPLASPESLRLLRWCSWDQSN